MNSGTQQTSRRSPIRDAVERTRPLEWVLLGVIVLACILRLTLLDLDSTAGDRVDGAIFLALAIGIICSAVADRRERPGRPLAINAIVLAGLALLMSLLRFV